LVSENTTLLRVRVYKTGDNMNKVIEL
jgi:hypothetical protein